MSVDARGHRAEGPVAELRRATAHGSGHLRTTRVQIDRHRAPAAFREPSGGGRTAYNIDLGYGTVVRWIVEMYAIQKAVLSATDDVGHRRSRLSSAS